MATYEGTPGDDIHHGTSGGDLLFGRDGNDELYGHGDRDNLRGDLGDDQLFGGAGHDRLDGGLGNDLLIGGDGNDLLIGREGVDHFDGGNDDGVDLQLSPAVGDRIGFFQLTATEGVVADLRTGIITNDGFGNREAMTGIESITSGSPFTDQLYGNDVANSLYGGTGDTVMGFGGDDDFFLDGAPTLIDGGDGVDTLTSIDTTKYVPDFDGQVGADHVTAIQGVTVDLARNLVIDAFGDEGMIRGIENFAGSRGYYDDVLRGDGNANVIRGLGGGDHVDGRGGRDTIDYSEEGHYGLHAVQVDLAAGYADDVQLYEVPGEPGGSRYARDTLVSIEDVIGTGRSDRLLGNASANRIAPGAGDDFVDGRDGIDTVDYSNVRTAVTIDLSRHVAVQAGSGAGSVTFNGVMIDADDRQRTRDRLYNIENVLGSGQDDRITGNGGANRIDGGAGDDVIALSGGGDILLGGGGFDTVDYSFATARTTIHLGTGTASVLDVPAADRLVGFENAAGSAWDGDRLFGTSQRNRLDGGAGADQMAGGAGNDVYLVDHVDDRSFEGQDAGVDQVYSAVDFTLGAHLERLVLTGAADLAGSGNSLANILRGNGGANVLNGQYGNDLLNGGAGDDSLQGGRGADRLTGGAGRDSFLFDTVLRGEEVDRIVDFSVVDDIIGLDRSIFRGLSDGPLGDAVFAVGRAASDADDRIVYDSATGRVLYDADGSGSAAAILFARVATGTELTAADFFVYG